MPAPIKWLEDTLVGVSDDTGQGGAIRVFSGSFSIYYTGAGGSLNDRTYLTSGSPVGSGSLSADMVGQIDTATLAGGGTLTAWTELGEGTGRDIHVSASFGDIVIPAAAGDQVDPVVVGGADGGFAVAYNNLAVSGGALVIRFYDPQGDLITTRAAANTTPGVYPSSVGGNDNVSVTNVNGVFLAVWGDGSPQEIRLARFGAEGDAIGSEVLVSTPGQISRHPTITDLPEGDTLVTWLVIDGVDVTVMGRFYSGATAQGGQFVIMDDVISSSSQNVSVAALSDGRMVVIARSVDGDIVGQMLFDDGSPDGARFTVNSDTVGTTSNPEVAALADGRFAVTWTDDQTGDDNQMLAIFDPRESGAELAGTDRFDTFYGTRFDDVMLLAGGADTGWGGAGADRLNGDAGNDSLFGEADADILKGGTGDDRLYGGTGADRLDGGAGQDTAYYAGAAAGVTVSVTAGTGGEAAGDVLISIENLTGSDFDDVLTGGAGVNTLNGSIGDDALIGAAGDDMLIGSVGDDVLEGGLGADQLLGGDGLDRAYYARSVTGVTVRLWDGTAIGGDAEGDTFSAIENITGSANSDTLEGNAEANVLIGGGGNDTLRGREGNDVLNGATGDDVMVGGTGNDEYRVDSLGDQVIEATGEGADKVLSSVSFNAATADAAGIENVELLGSASLNALGNALNNILTGNAGNNGLNGGEGADVLLGGLGDDTYTLDDLDDVVIEAPGAGTDYVRSSVSYTLGDNIENLTLQASAAINGIGNDLGNAIVGNTGANIIAGKGGADILTGGAGSDTFDYNAVTESSYSVYDRITDLTNADKIDLSGIDANTGVAGNQAFVKVAAFTHHAGEITLAYNAAAQFTVLSADVNGDGVADMRIVINGDHQTFTNFVY